MMTTLIYFLLCCTLISCTADTSCVPVDSPFAVVVKLESAEFLKEYDRAERYIDVEAVYSGIAQREGISPDSLWRLVVEGRIRLGESSRKFTGRFSFHRYDACELIHGDSAEVVFRESGVTKDSLVDVYRLARRDNSWKIISIKYNVHKY